MSTPFSKFADIATQRFEVAPDRRRNGICGPLVHDRGTRSYSVRLAQSGWTTLGDLEGKTVADLIGRVETTRPNFDNVLRYLRSAGVTVVSQ